MRSQVSQEDTCEYSVCTVSLCIVSSANHERIEANKNSTMFISCDESHPGPESYKLEHTKPTVALVVIMAAFYGRAVRFIGRENHNLL